MMVSSQKVEFVKCKTCGRVREIRPSGECFACHVKGIGFTWVGGEGYGRQAFHDMTYREAIEQHKPKNMETEPRHTKANTWAPVK
jgi:hypothetical protein